MEFGLDVTASVGLRAGDEIAATVGHSVIGGRLAIGRRPVRTLSFEQGVRCLRTWGRSDGSIPADPVVGSAVSPTSSQGPVRSIFTIRIVTGVKTRGRCSLGRSLNPVRSGHFHLHRTGGRGPDREPDGRTQPSGHLAEDRRDALSQVRSGLSSQFGL